MTDRLKLASLYKHWVVADSVNYHVQRSMKNPEQGVVVVSEAMRPFAEIFSGMQALSVWYSLLYVVIEGYCELNLKDDDIDELITNEPFVEALRRFRNAHFHYQQDPLSPKIMEFLAAKGSAHWIRQLNRAFEGFFCRQLDVEAVLERLRDEEN